MKIGAAFPSKYIKVEDLNGKEYTVTVNRVVIEDVGSDKDPEDKPVIYFNGRQKGMVLNKTNATAIADAYGDDTDGWTDKEVILRPDTTMYQGKMVPCLRVRTPTPAANPADDIPF